MDFRTFDHLIFYNLLYIEIDLIVLKKYFILYIFKNYPSVNSLIIYYRVKDLTRTWQDIVVQNNDQQIQDNRKVSYRSFLEYYSRINVAEMSGKF